MEDLVLFSVAPLKKVNRRYRDRDRCREERTCVTPLLFFEVFSWTSQEVRRSMAVDMCKVCLESVSATCSGVECEVCDTWFHTACVGLQKASSKMLSHKNIVFLCDECINDARERMKNRKEDKTDRATQTSGSGMHTQTEDAEVGGTQTVHPPQPQADKALQTESVSEQQ